MKFKFFFYKHYCVYLQTTEPSPVHTDPVFNSAVCGRLVDVVELILYSDVQCSYCVQGGQRDTPGHIRNDLVWTDVDDGGKALGTAPPCIYLHRR